MRNLVGACIFLLCTGALAQAPATSSSSVILVAPPAGQGCPVAFQARHANQGAVVNVSPESKHSGQAFQLTFQPFKDVGIVQAKITMHGIAGGQIVPAAHSTESESPNSNPTSKKDNTEAFTVSPSSGGKHLFHSTVYTEKLTGVQWVELNEIRYTDGTVWHESANAVCRVAPNGYMLVAGGK